MTPEHIQRLVRMAEEIEALERSAGESVFDRSSGHPAQFRLPDPPAPIPFSTKLNTPHTLATHAGSRRVWSRWVAAASIALIGAMGWQALQPAYTSLRSKPRIITQRPATLPGTPDVTISEVPSKQIGMDRGIEATAPADSAGPAVVATAQAPAVLPAEEPGCDSAEPLFATVVIAVALDADSGCRAHHKVIHQFPGWASAESIHRSDLLRVGLESLPFSSPDGILVVSITGPVEDLPHTEQEAELKLACTDMRRLDPVTNALVGEFGHDEAKYAAAMQSCVADNLTVEAATMMGNSGMPKAFE
ncbi:MAG: hypothetical protein JSR77_16410 [Planctomycetes bacterium]|nr:hypothetical protein [Planctomycetota bacterium]